MTASVEQLQSVAFHETLPDSHEVYTAVIKKALDYNLMGGEYGARAREMYTDMGVKRVELQPYRDDLGCHRGYDADQTIQLTGAYKDRAAAGMLLGVSPKGKRVHIASAGNAGAAYARQHDDVVVHHAESASPEKVQRIRAYGAATVSASESGDRYIGLEDAQNGAQAAGEADDALSLHPFDHESVIAGNATAGFEIVDDLLHQHVHGELDVHEDPIKLFVPVGGGGLIAGVAIAIKWAKEQGYIGEDNVQVIGVQMEGCDAMKRTVDYMQAGYEPPEDLFAEGLPFNANSDGTAVRKPGRLTTAIAADKTFVHDLMLVPEGLLGYKMRRQYERTGKKYEPAGMLARTAAAQYAAAHQDTPEVLVTITSGANVSDELFDKMVASGNTYMQGVWSTELADRNVQRDALYALGGIAVNERPPRQPAGYGYGPAPQPIASRKPGSKGRVLGATFSRY